MAQRKTKIMQKSTRVPATTVSSKTQHKVSIGEEFGQHEPLTTRLNRLLEDYTDGFSVLKELVQNADDAGATEVRFLYDERTNQDRMTWLLDEGMKECQGPALWVYNDAVFRDEDFENIQKLSGATKEQDTEKIGKFGLGFNAVYNLTDVPMFLSRNYFVVFDPHRSHLNAMPGIRIDLREDSEELWRYEDQFKPFNGIFGCDLHLDKKDNSFDGTLFRFPLRTREQALRSKIKQLHYNDHEMRELLQMFLDGAENLLIFTQNVLRVGIYNLPKNKAKNPQTLLLFQVTKSESEAGIQRTLSFPITLPATAERLTVQKRRFLEQCNFLQVASKFTKEARDRDVDPDEFPKSTLTLSIDSTFTASGFDFFNVDSSLKQKTVTWLVASSMGRGRAMQFIKDHGDTSLVPSGGVAVQLVPTEPHGTFIPLPVVKKVDGLDVNGTVFCYLPLPIHSGLPVHINGAFAVASNRRHLQEKLEDDKSCYGVKWNKVLMQDCVCSAFLSLLEDLKSLVPDGDWYKFHLLWPTNFNVHHNFRPLLTSFYEKVASGISLFSDGVQWGDIKQVLFLDPEFRMEPQIGDTSFEVLQMLHGNSKVIIDLPSDVFESFEMCDLKNEINPRSYSKNRFFRECFFKNISSGIIPASQRDVLTLHALDDFREDFKLLLKQYACIPASPSGKTLKCPSQLVNPDSEAASLFCPGDGRFPFGNEESYLNFQRLAKLKQLGMVSDDLPWSEVAERAENIHKLNITDSHAALKRVKALLKFMDTKLKRRISPSTANCQRLLKAKFIPVLKKPTDFPLPWEGGGLQGRSQVLLSPKEVFLEKEKYRVCCTQPLAGVSIPSNVQECLKLDKKHPTLNHVIQQLYAAMSTRVNLLNAAEYKELNHVCTEAYTYLQQASDLNGDKCLEYLSGKSFILVERRFLSARQVAFKLAADCPPHLFKLPQHLANAFPDLLKAAGVKDKFDEKDYTSSLHDMKKQFGDTTVDEQNLQVASYLAVQLGETLKVSKVHPSEVQGMFGTVYLPDSKGVMRPVSDLCIRNCPWIPDDPRVLYVNDKIPWPVCTQVGVKTRREEALKRHAIGLPCGQKEKLTNRLKRILTGYPCEKEILKELLQNADDAQATEICFIKDPRQHPKQRVFEDSWQPLQGPALCVYNNKPFTNADIEGIQNLGEGSKGEDPNKTGQYGVGFNAVYHLTDAPSFISKGDDIGDVLCVFDPNCKYVPGASPEEPGREFIVNSALETDFPDVFPCYLGEHFPRDNATMFRFPLRTEEMARESKISSKCVSLRKLDAMMEELKQELFEVLLFVNNVKKITLCEVNEAGGKLTNVYTVEATMSKEDESKRQAFANYIKAIAKWANERTEVLPNEVPVGKVSYVLNISDTFGKEEKWLIVQQMGFEKSVKSSIIDAFKVHQLGMLPRGGVACLLEGKNSKHRAQRRKRAYCFLPLPVETNLPVHINGHFALDHEARRNLWRDEAGRGGYRSDWNSALLRDVIASCYVTLLVEVRTFIKLPIEQGETSYTEDDILRKIDVYETIFPRQPPNDQYWKTLVDSVYQEINRKELQILPVVSARPLNATQSALKSNTIVEVTWFPPTGSGRQQAFFNNLGEKGPFTKSPQAGENQERLRVMFEAILLKSGFNLVAFSMAVHESFRRSEVATHSVSPSFVIDFYKTFSSRDPLCTIGSIPLDVTKTVFESSFGVILVLLYCKCAEDFVDRLPDLPLLLTQDNCLQLFSSRQPKILSRYHDLLPASPEIFLHELVDRKVFSGFVTLKSSVLKPLDAQAFVSYLPETLPRERYGKAEFVSWAPEQKAIPNRRWISRLWDFLHELVRDLLSDAKIDESCKVSKIKAALGPLWNWSILPVTKSRSVQSTSFFRWIPRSEYLLVPLKHAESVLDLRNPDSASTKLVDVLRKLGLPELNCAALSSTSSSSFVYSSSNSVALAGILVSSLKVPASLLSSLHQTMVLDPQSIKERLEPSDCRVILEYFSTSVGCLQDTDRSTLRSLPFYLATHGGFISLDDAEVCVLPIGIPRDEIDVLEDELDVVFVESWQSVAELFKFLKLKGVSAVGVYCSYILTNFSILSCDAREVHLRYIIKYILSDFVTEDGEKQRVLDCLRSTPLLPSADGCLQTASCFYDPGNDVFRAMLSDSNFPSEPFNSSEWITFLKKIGLVHEVSLVNFRKFATELADEAAIARTESTKRKSEVLVRHLISRHNVVKEGLLEAVRDIPFVAADPVQQPLQDLCPPFTEANEDEDELLFISFQGAAFVDHEEIVWTQAHLLPEWADPRFHRYELGCPRSRIDQYCDEFLSKLQVVKTPSVDLVVRHCQAVCSHLENNQEYKIASSVHCSSLVTVMEHIYKFLEENATVDNKAKNRLKATPCILVEQGRKFVKPSQAVLELYEDREIKPFLYRVPAEFGKFQRLFEYLGCSKSVKPTHYAMVLKKLRKNCQNNKLHPNEVTLCTKAVKGFFETLQENPDDASLLSKLYLPAIPPRMRASDSALKETPVTLHKSKELVFDDAPAFEGRILELDLLFVLELNLMEVELKSAMINFKELMMKLSAPLQPVMLSSVVKEELTDGEIVTSGAVKVLMQRLSSPQFVRGMVRIMRDVNSRKKSFDDRVIANIEEGLKSIELCAVEKLQTALLYNGDFIPGSEKEVQSFKEKVVMAGEETYRVYVKVPKGSDDGRLARSLVSKVIADIYGEFLGKNAVLIPEMLDCPLGDIWSLLDRNDIRQDDTYKAAEMDIYPKPGTFIPIEDHHLLNDAFVEFEPGEYVGCQLDDPSLQLEEGVATYIYAVIIEEVINEDDISERLTKKYMVNIGHDKEPVIVNAINLHKFHRLQEISECPRHRNREIVLDEISEVLEDALELPEEQRRQVVKRLVLRWHPETNLGDEEFCSGVFEHIKKEIARLGFPYDEYIDIWIARAKEQSLRRKEYKEKLIQQYGPELGSSGRRLPFPPSFSKRNPQPGEARRWFRQAEADLAAGANEIDFNRPSYEWACFKCHQAAEKALKAAQYTIDADKASVHNLVENCIALNDSELTNLARMLETLVGGSARMRYPDQMCWPKIPNEVYSAQMAQQALELSQKIIVRVKSRIP